LRIEYENGTLSTRLWNITNSQGLNWIQSAVNIGKIVGSQISGWKLRFSSTITGQAITYFNDAVAIDDISFVKCNPNNLYQEIKCNFSTDFCGFTNEIVNTQFNWTRIKGTTSTDDTGPPGDQ